MEIPGTKTETETIEQALDMLVFRDRLVQGTNNTADFDLIRRVEPVQAVLPWPHPGR